MYTVHNEATETYTKQTKVSRVRNFYYQIYTTQSTHFKFVFNLIFSDELDGMEILDGMQFKNKQD